MQLLVASSVRETSPCQQAVAAVDRRPLAPTAGGTLRLGQPDPLGREFISAASGLAAAGGALWAVSDEYGMLARFDALAAPGLLHPALPATKQKPDLEALVRLPALDAGAGATLLALGSGTNRHRLRGVRQDVDAGGVATGPARVVDLAPLLAALATRLPMGPNVEGAAWRDAATGAELLLLHRGRLAGDRNVVFRLDGAEVLDALRAGRPLPASAIVGEHQVELGMLGRERLGFADARALPDGRIAFAASAEGEDGTGDGPIRGSAIGILDAQLRLVALRPLEGPPRKVEGIELARELDPQAPADRLVLVTDPDDPSRPTEVLGVDL